jgi:hypothetical protein
MKLRPLLLALAVLLPVSALVWWLGRPSPAPSATDPRIGQRVADPAGLATAARVSITHAGKSIELRRGPGDTWTVTGQPALPADTSRLTRLTRDLVEPRIERLVSARPEKIATYELDTTTLTFADPADAVLLDLDLGKNIDGGRRLLRYADEPRAYAAKLDLWLDAEPSSWRDTALVAPLTAAEIASVRITFPDTALPIVVSRPDAAASWTSPATPAGQQVKSSVVANQLSSLTSLRYTDLAPKIDPGVIAAKIFPRELTLVAFDGREVKFSFGRAPEPPPPSPPAEGEAAATPPPPADRPVYVSVEDPRMNPVLGEAGRTHVFVVADWVFTGLPAAVADLFEAVPTPPAPAPDAASSTPSDAVAPDAPTPAPDAPPSTP